MKRIRLDEVVNFGPLSIARAGKNLLFANNMSDVEHQSLLARLSQMHKEVFVELKKKISDLQRMVGEYDPVVLLHRAAYELFPLLIKYRSEAEFSREENLSLPSVEYLQFLISRSESSEQKKELSVDDWTTLWALTKEIIQLMSNWIFSRPTLDTPPNEIDELRFVLDNKNLMMRVDRYGFFLQDYWVDALTPYDPWLKELFGVDAQMLIVELGKIQEYQKHGIIGRYINAIQASSELMLSLEAKGFNVSPTATIDEIEAVRIALETDEFRSKKEELDEKFSLALTPAIFDITEIASLPAALLDILSVAPGESIQTDLESKDDISPLSRSTLHSKPFLKANGRYYHFFHTGLEDRVAELVEQALFNKLPHAIDSMMERRGLRLEERGLSLLDSILASDHSYLNVFYPDPDHPGQLTELDGLIAVDDVLILMECKAGKFSDAATRGAPKSLLKDLSDLIVEGQRQSERAEKYINSTPRADFFDQSGKNKVCTITREKFRRVFRIIVTREQLGWVGAKIARLSVLDEKILKSAPWHVSLDDLRVVADIFNNRGPQFCHYLQVRLAVAEAGNIDQFDEVDHIGIYLDRNHYQIPVFTWGNRMTYTEYGKPIDIHFAQKHAGEPVDVLQQYMPPLLGELLDNISSSKEGGRYATTALLLSLSKDGRDDVEAKLKQLYEAYRVGRRLSFRFPLTDLGQGISVSLTSDANYETEKARSGALLASSGCQTWFIVRLSKPSELLSIESIDPSSLPQHVVEDAQNDIDRKIFKQVANEKVGRNAPCPCGSGKKFKKCHGK